MLAFAQVPQSRPRFRFENFLRKEYNFGLDPERPICEYWAGPGSCPNGADCPNKHPSKVFGNKVVCKYWLRGLCKMGDDCDFLHEYNLAKMPECAYFAQTGTCQQGADCIYLHVDPQSKIPECHNYTNMGFCPEGPNCTRRHARRPLCPIYLTGFCPLGPNCPDSHPKFNPALLQGRLKIRKDEDILNARKKKPLVADAVEDEGVDSDGYDPMEE